MTIDRLRSGLVMAIAATATCTVSSAQEAATSNPQVSVEEIIVTGSRIPRPAFESLQPTTVVDRATLENRGSLDVARNLNEQSGFILPQSPVAGQQSTAGQNLVNFLGLGTERTLTLVNGHRLPTNSRFSLAVDLNTIPETLVERIETIAVGGAPIYGSDAIAGTVNIILRDDFDGFEIAASAGMSPEYGDALETRVSATWGINFGDQRGNLAISAQYFAADGLKETDRPVTDTLSGFEAPADPDSPYLQQYYDDLVVAIDNDGPYPLFFGDVFFLNLFGNGIPLDINDPMSPLGQFDADGNLVPFVPGGGTGSTFFQYGGDGLALADFGQLLTDYDRYNANAFLTYDVSESTTLHAEAWFARTDAENVAIELYYNSPIFGGLPDNSFGNLGEGPIPVLIDNPFLTDATRASIRAALNIAHDFDGDGSADPTIDTDGDGVADAVGFWRGGPLRDVDLSPTTTTQDTIRALLGLAGEADIGSLALQWDATLSYGRTSVDNSYIALHQPNFDQAVQVVASPGGTPECADTSGGCEPFNAVGTPSREAIDFVSQPITNSLTTDQTSLTGNVVGNLLQLPAGSLAAAAGFAWRRERADYQPNELSRSGVSRYDDGDPLDDGFTSTEFYVEAVIPLLGGDLDTPGIAALDFEGAIRYVDHSVVGGDTTWTAGLRYLPVPDLELRGNITEAIRAPSIGELFLPPQNIFNFADDPCDERFIGQGKVPDVRAANCATDGIIQPFRSFVVDASQPGVASGNDDLVSEIAESRTYGLVLRPRFWDRFTMSVDWFEIEILNAIEFLDLGEIMAACYDSTSFNAEPACDLFMRDAVNQVVDFQAGFVNVSVLEFTGLQTVMEFNTDIGRFGDLHLSVNHLYTERRRETVGSGDTQRHDGQIGESSHRVTANITWNNTKWTWFNQLRWLDTAVFDNRDDEFTRDIRGVDDWLIVNSSLRYQFDEHLDLQLTVDNLFDSDPPYAATGLDVGIPTYYPGILGRYARLQARYRF